MGVRSILLGLVATVVVAVGGFVAATWPRAGMLASVILARAPSTAFAATAQPPAPDYTKLESWAALPDLPQNPAMSTPAGVSRPANESLAADVFFIHPTTFFGSATYNQPLDDDATNQRTDTGTIRQQASAFNDCCRVFAPRFRQASFAAMVAPGPDSAAAQALAGEDVAAAFRHYFATWNQGRPFIIASHSQGSRIALEFIKREIDGTPAAKQLVAAYVVGVWVPMTWVEGLRDIKACDGPQDTTCVVAWSTYQEGANLAEQRANFVKRAGWAESIGQERFLCTNPLTWLRDGALAPASLNLGGWVRGMGTTPRAPDLNVVSARCHDGGLLISEPEPSAYHRLKFPGGNYHNYDYQLFYMNVRANARARVEAFASRPSVDN